MSTLFTAQPGLAGKRIRLTTDTQREPRALLPIEGTRYRLAVPYTLPTTPYDEQGFDFGGIHFTVVRRYGHFYALRPDRPLPASWLVDLSGEVPKI